MTDQTVYGDIRDTLVQLPHNPWGGYPGTYVVSDIFPTKWELLQREASDATSVFEFGALMGYFLVTALDACPRITRVGWVDTELHSPNSNRLCCENINAWLRIGKTPHGKRGRIERRWFDKTYPDVLAHILHTRGAEAPAQYDVVHVDGEHTYHACMIDLTLGLAMNPRLLLVDDYQAIGEVRSATDDFARYMGLQVEEVTTANGLAVIRP